MIDASSIELANRWKDRTVHIVGKGGLVQILDDKTRVVKTYAQPRPGYTSGFVVRTSSEIPGAVAFQVLPRHPAYAKPRRRRRRHAKDDDDDGSRLYLTVPPYGDELRQDAAQELASVPNLLHDTIPLIVDYAIEPTRESFEGTGFNYAPMYVVRNEKTSAPTKIQLFILERASTWNDEDVGVRSLFGTYWRSQHWDGIVSQAPHLDQDETWKIRASVPSGKKQSKHRRFRKDTWQFGTD